MNETGLLRKLSRKISNKESDSKTQLKILQDQVESLKQELLESKSQNTLCLQNLDYYQTKVSNTVTNDFIRHECQNLVNVISSELLNELHEVRQKNKELQNDLVYFIKLMESCKRTSATQDLDNLLESLQQTFN